jgi:hypothetical protein
MMTEFDYKDYTIIYEFDEDDDLSFMQITDKQDGENITSHFLLSEIEDFEQMCGNHATGKPLLTLIKKI